MSSILENIAAELGPTALAQIGSAIGANSSQTQSAVAAALPALIAGLAKNTSSQSGAQSLANALDRDHTPPLASQFGALAGMLGGDSGGGGLGALAGMLGGGQQQSSGIGDLLGAAVSMMGGQAAPAQRPKALDGMGILGHILGNKQSNVEQGVAKASGLDIGSIAKLLPVLAPILMSALGTMKKSQGLDAQGLASAIGQEQQQISQQAGLASMLDLDNDGSMMDEVASIGGMLAKSGLLGNLFG